jgi:hypothetical protein
MTMNSLPASVTGCPGELVEEDVVADLHRHGHGDPGLVDPPVADGEHQALGGLLLDGLGDEDPALGLLHRVGLLEDTRSPIGRMLLNSSDSRLGLVICDGISIMASLLLLLLRSALRSSMLLGESWCCRSVVHARLGRRLGRDQVRLDVP